MASIFKRSYKIKMPSGEIVTKELDHYTISYTNSAGKRCRVKGYRDKKATEQKAARVEKALSQGEEGLVDKYREHKAVPLVSHITEYADDLRAKGRAPKYCENAEKRLTRLAEACCWVTLPDINAGSFAKWREKTRKTEKKARGGLVMGAAARTLNQYLEHARSFMAWCKAMGRFGVDPLADVAKVSGEAVRKRRALSDEQAAKLLDVSPDSRKLFNRLAMAVGLRRSEMEALKWGDVRLNAIRPYIQLRAEATKARRADRLTLPPTLAVDLRSARTDESRDGDRVFPEPPTLNDWKADLHAAGIPWMDDLGRQVDFHAGTRKTLCTRMNRAGVPLAVAMRIMRHADARLTMVDYTDDAQLGMDEILAAIPEPTTTPAKAPTTATAGA